METSEKFDCEADKELKGQLEAIESGEYVKWLEKEAQGSKWNEEEELDAASPYSSEAEESKEVEENTLFQYPQPSQSQNSKSVSKTGSEKSPSSRKPSVRGDSTERSKERKASNALNFSSNIEGAEEDKEKPWKFLCGAELEERRRNLANIDHQLTIQAMEYKEKKHSLNKRWEKVYSKQSTLIHALRKFEVVKHDCREKRRIAQEAHATAKAETDKILKGIEEGERDLRHLSHLLVKCQERLERNKTFKNFLKEVQGEANGEFKTIKQVSDRALNLQMARQRLVSWNLQNHEDIRTAIYQLYRANQNGRSTMLRQSGILSEVLRINGFIANHLATLAHDVDVTHVKTRTQYTLTGQIHLSINNLYIELSKQLQMHPTLKSTEPLKQLKSIGSFMKQLQNLFKDIRTNAQIGSDNVFIEVDTQALLKERLKYKL